MVRITYRELAEGKYQSSIVDSRPLYGSYAKLLREVLSDNLTKKQKYYIILYYRDNLTVQQIAQQCGVNKSTVSRTLKRARERLAKAIKCELVRRANTK